MSNPNALTLPGSTDDDRTLRAEALAGEAMELAVRIPWAREDGQVEVTPAEVWLDKASARRLAAFLLRWADGGQS